ncbi:MAG: hypothetical protein P1U58_05760 [Verrucomicrobiales bacterium]|nr:hypothetical protein [Verrucomicrobiales bacterium]
MRHLRFLPLLATLVISSTSGSAQNSQEARSVLVDPARSAQFAIVNSAIDGKWAPLSEGADLYTNSEKYQWKDVPQSLVGTHFLSLPIHQGFVEFDVASDGFVFLVTSTRWGGGGNSSGDWLDEVMLERDLRRAGWRELKGVGDLTAGDPGEMIIFWRHSEQGEKYRVRTEKYVAPMLLIRPIL